MAGPFGLDLQDIGHPAFAELLEARAPEAAEAPLARELLGLQERARLAVDPCPHGARAVAQDDDGADLPMDGLAFACRVKGDVAPVQVVEREVAPRHVRAEDAVRRARRIGRLRVGLAVEDERRPPGRAREDIPMFGLDDAPSVAEDDPPRELGICRNHRATLRDEFLRRRVRRDQKAGEKRDHAFRAFRSPRGRLPPLLTSLFIMRIL